MAKFDSKTYPQVKKYPKFDRNRLASLSSSRTFCQRYMNTHTYLMRMMKNHGKENKRMSLIKLTYFAWWFIAFFSIDYAPSISVHTHTVHAYLILANPAAKNTYAPFYSTFSGTYLILCVMFFSPPAVSTITYLFIWHFHTVYF